VAHRLAALKDTLRAPGGALYVFRERPGTCAALGVAAASVWPPEFPHGPACALAAEVAKAEAEVTRRGVAGRATAAAAGTDGGSPTETTKAVPSQNSADMCAVPEHVPHLDHLDVMEQAAVAAAVGAVGAAAADDTGTDNDAAVRTAVAGTGAAPTALAKRPPEPKMDGPSASSGKLTKQASRTEVSVIALAKPSGNPSVDSLSEPDSPRRPRPPTPQSSIAARDGGEPLNPPPVAPPPPRADAERKGLERWAPEDDETASEDGDEGSPAQRRAPEDDETASEDGDEGSPAQRRAPEDDETASEDGDEGSPAPAPGPGGGGGDRNADSGWGGDGGDSTASEEGSSDEGGEEEVDNAAATAPRGKREV